MKSRVFRHLSVLTVLPPDCSASLKVLTPDSQSKGMSKKVSLEGDRDGCRGVPLPVLPLLLLFAFVIGNAKGTPGVPLRSARVASVHSFTINDFDGDHRPDLASILSVQSRAATANYLIQIQLSTTGWRTLCLEGPSGGLRIEARDVNQDNAIDLVLATSLHGHPVAIFLNDGHGNFSPGEPAAFPGAFDQFDKNWGSTSRQQSKVIGTPPQSRPDISWKAEQRSICPKHAGLFLGSTSQVSVSPFVFSYAGRAPPCAVP
jgi:hypothetical protein